MLARLILMFIVGTMSFAGCLAATVRIARAATCPPGTVDVTDAQCSPTNGCPERIRFDRVAEGEVKRYCVRPGHRLSWFHASTIDRSGVAQCTNVCLELNPPATNERPKSCFNNNTVGYGQPGVPLADGRWIMRVEGFAPGWPPPPSSCADNPFLLVFKFDDAGPLPSPGPTPVPGPTRTPLPQPTGACPPCPTCPSSTPTPAPTPSSGTPCHRGDPGWHWSDPRCGVFGGIPDCRCLPGPAPTAGPSPVPTPRPTPQPSPTPRPTASAEPPAGSPAPVGRIDGGRWFPSVGRQPPYCGYSETWGTPISLGGRCSPIEWWNFEWWAGPSLEALVAEAQTKVQELHGVRPWGAYVGEWGTFFTNSTQADELREVNRRARAVRAALGPTVSIATLPWTFSRGNLPDRPLGARSCSGCRNLALDLSLFRSALTKLDRAVTDVNWQMSNGKAWRPSAPAGCYGYTVAEAAWLGPRIAGAIRATGRRAHAQIELTHDNRYFLRDSTGREIPDLWDTEAGRIDCAALRALDQAGFDDVSAFSAGMWEEARLGARIEACP